MCMFAPFSKRAVVYSEKLGRILPFLILLIDSGQPAPVRADPVVPQITAGKSLEVNPEIFEKIKTLVAAGQFDDAEKLLDSHLPSDTAAASGYFRLGKLYFEHQAWSRSVLLFQKSLRLDSGNDQARLLLGLAWRELGDQEKAESELREAARQNPKNDLNSFMAGHQLLIDGKYEAALDYLYRSVELNPLRIDALRALGMALARVGNYGLAEGYYRKAIEAAGSSGPESFSAHTDLAYLLTLSHDPNKLTEGLRCAQQAIQLHPSSAVAHYLAGKALLKLGRLTAAIRELTQAEKIEPEDSKPHFLLAQAYDRLGDAESTKKERDALIKTKRSPGLPGVATGGLSLNTKN